jgi:hypothetical protein
VLGWGSGLVGGAAQGGSGLNTPAVKALGIASSRRGLAQGVSLGDAVCWGGF